MILCILIISIIVIIFLYFYKTNNSINTTKSLSPHVEGFTTYVFDRIPPFNGEDYLDTLFDDVMYYPNEVDEKLGWTNGVTGWMRCKSMCNGNCVEYGVTGNAYCFPY